MRTFQLIDVQKAEMVGETKGTSKRLLKMPTALSVTLSVVALFFRDDRMEIMFNDTIDEWLGDTKWEKLDEEAKRSWREEFWKPIKINFDGAGGKHVVPLPLECLVPSRIRKRGSKTSPGKPQPLISRHSLHLER